MYEVMNSYTSLLLTLLFSLSVCNTEIFTSQILQKCCGMDHAWNVTSHQCVPENYEDKVDWYPQLLFHKASSTTIPIVDVAAKVDMLNCTGINETLVHSEDFILLDDLSVWLLRTEEFLPVGDYCIDKTYKTNHHVVITCGLAPCMDKPCVRKCCGDDAILNQSSISCINYGHGIEGKDELAPWLLNFSTSDFEIISGVPSCDHGIYRLQNEPKMLDANGELIMINTSKVLEQNMFCLDRVIDEDGNNTIGGFACFPNTSMLIENPDEWFNTVRKGSSLIISSFCLMIALLLTLTVEMTGRNSNLHARIQASHLSSLGMAEFLLALALLIPHYLPQNVCTALGLLAHYFLISAFAWLSAMCFNIWWTFREIRPVAETWQHTSQWLCLCIWGWGIPLILSSVALGLDLSPTLPSHIPAPGFGQLNCWVAGSRNEFVYVYAPVGFLLTSNVIFFILTAKELLCGAWRRNGPGQVSAGRESPALLCICVKLFIVMGVAWIGEMASWATGGHHWLWEFTDGFNSLQGVLILCILSCRQRTHETISRQCSSLCTCCSGNTASRIRLRMAVMRKPSVSTTQVEESYA